MRPLALALCCLLILCGCAPVVKKDMLVPAPAAEVARLTRLRVAAFDNDPGGQIRAAVESALASIVVEGRPYFTMVGANAPATDLGKPLQWVDTSKSKGQPIRYGAEGTVQGNVNQNGWQDERYSEMRRECVAEDAKGRCRLWGSTTVLCIRRVARFSFTPRVVAKDTGAVLFSQEFSETGQDSACLGEDGSPTGGPALLAVASKKAIARFRNEVAPHSVTVDIPLLTEDGSGMSAQVKTLVAGGVDFAKAGQTGKACALWRSAARSHAAGHALPYLSGVCAELEDDLDQAEDFYALAEQRAPKPVPEITAALARIKNTRASQGRLEQQLK
jgi:hypothetical protein